MKSLSKFSNCPLRKSNFPSKGFPNSARLGNLKQNQKKLTQPIHHHPALPTPHRSPFFPQRSFSTTPSPPKTKNAPVLRRVLFNVPGSDQRKINKSKNLNLDCVVLDLEDGVAVNQKQVARETVLQNFLNSNKDPANRAFGRAERLIRINGFDSGLAADDISETVLPLITAKDLDGIVLPKVESVDHLEELVSRLQKTETQANHKVGFLAAIESPLALLNLKEICQKFVSRHPDRLKALIFASEDFVASAGMTRTPSAQELLYARSAVATHASAYGIQSIDMVCLDYKNSDHLKQETLQGIQMGFTGKQAIHPNQIEPIYETYMPSPEKLSFATRILEENEKFQKEGKGAFTIDDKMIDMPMVKWAQVIVDRARIQ